jgi:ACS family D-galactonate transporter-like MFS transporter
MTPHAAIELRPSRVRYLMLGLIVIAVTINYLDRAIIGIAAPAIREQFHLDAAELGWVFSAFSWSYLVFQIPGGIALDRFGVRLVYAVALAGWSAFTFLQGLAQNIWVFILFRLGLGAFEAPCFPANSNLVAMWFPRRERGRAIGIYTAAEYVGLGFLSPLFFWILAHWGWHWLFLIPGAIGLLFAFVMYGLYRDPHQSARVNAAERRLIEEGGGLTQAGAKSTHFRWPLLFALLRQRRMWGLIVGQFAVYATFVFFLTWFPTYLATERHMTFLKMGVVASIPYIAGFFGILFAGFLSDFLVGRVRLEVARKLPVLMGLLMASTIVAAAFLDNDALIIGILSFAFFGQAMSSSGWTVISEVAPEGLLGLVGGLFSFAANLSGVVIPIVIGLIVQYTHSFFGALAFIGAIAAVGAFSWLFVVGPIERLEIKGRAAEALRATAS